MAVVNNTASEIGDVILISSANAITGLLSLLNYTDSTTGETGTRYFQREFRYSVVGPFNFSDWIPLTDINLVAVSVSSLDFFYIEYKYTRIGTDNTGLLEFHNITVNGAFQTVNCGTVFQGSIFAEFVSCTDIAVLNWCVNVTDKAYQIGMIPNYITRGAEKSTIIDRDYIDFWRTVSCFFAMIVAFGRKFQSFKTYKNILYEFLNQRNVYNNNQTSQADLNYILNNYLDEVRQRGTQQIFKEKNGIKLIDGELLRLIGYNLGEEFLFNLVRREKFGWIINKASPMFLGMSDQIGVNKAYEDTQNLVALSKYPRLNSQYVYKEHDAGEHKWVIEIKNVPASIKSGISPNNIDFSLVDFTKAIKVDSLLDYEITFWLKQPIADDSDSDSESDSGFWVGKNTQIAFRVYGFDVNNNLIDFQEMNAGASTNTFFENRSLNQDELYYFVRGIIFNRNEALRGASAEFLNIGFGQNLRFSNASIVKIIPEIVIDNTILGERTRLNFAPGVLNSFSSATKIRNIMSGLQYNISSINIAKNYIELSDSYGDITASFPINTLIDIYDGGWFGPYTSLTSELIDIGSNNLYIWDLKIKPLKTPFSTGFIQVSNFIEIWMKNNNVEKTEVEIEEIQRRYLLPYNTTFKNIYIK